MTFRAPSRCPRARRRATRAYPSSSPPPRRFSSSLSTSPPRDRPTVSAPHFLLPSSHRPKSPITQEDSPSFPSSLAPVAQVNFFHKQPRSSSCSIAASVLSFLFPLRRSTFVNVIWGDLCKPKTDPRPPDPAVPLPLFLGV